jgi:hypothetical protein
MLSAPMEAERTFPIGEMQAFSCENGYKYLGRSESDRQYRGRKAIGDFALLHCKKMLLEQGTTLL